MTGEGEWDDNGFYKSTFQNFNISTFQHFKCNCHAFGGKSRFAALYCYSPDRKGIHPQEHLRDYAGILQADGYAGYNGLYDIERSIKGKPPDERASVRQATAMPIIEALQSALENTREKISGKSPLAAAIRYATGCSGT